MKLNAPAFGATAGLSLGALIGVATYVVRMRLADGKNAGKTLQALGILPGYDIRKGSAPLVGLGWGLGLGFTGGLAFAILYNILASILGGKKS